MLNRFATKDYMQYKELVPFETRKLESMKIKAKYPTRLPIIVYKAVTSTIENIDKHKYLVPEDLTVGQFMYVIRKRIQLRQEEAIFLFINNRMPPVSCTIRDIYDNQRDPDGFLYIEYSGENCFGFS